MSAEISTFVALPLHPTRAWAAQDRHSTQMRMLKLTVCGERRCASQPSVLLQYQSAYALICAADCWT